MMKYKLRLNKRELAAYLSAEGCFHALRIRPTCKFSKLTLSSLSFSPASVSDGFFFSWADSFFPVDLFYKFQKHQHDTQQELQRLKIIVTRTICTNIDS